MRNIWKIFIGDLKKIKKNACNLFWFVIVCTRKTDVRNIRTPG